MATFAPDADGIGASFATVLTNIAMLGGTFDPIHSGHLRSAVELREHLNFDELRLVPCHVPPHRDVPQATSAQRLRMLELALADEPGLAIDARELQRGAPSYSIDTLIALRAELGAHCALSLIVGMDAFAQLHTWHRWQELLDYAHIVVIARPGSALPQSGAVADLLHAKRGDSATFAAQPNGSIVSVELTPLPISATAIRQLINSGHSPRYLLPDAVWNYIREQRLY
ncbi:MAG: nadD [Verrucomicrobiaceae bacterium]|nr:nadD [Verrucomicrobiaceae bacterium]